MLLQKTADGTLVKILDLQEIIDPTKDQIMGRVQSGEEEQDPELVEKQSLNFPSGESLPRCWIDPDYRRDKSA